MIKAVIWDIGGVLLTDPKLEDFWKGSEESEKIRRAFGSGEISTDKFVEKGSELLEISKEDFLKKYKKIYHAIYPIDKSLELYRRLNIDQYILSDTNPIHAENIRKEFPEIFNRARKSYFSYEIGRRKNSIDVFNFVVEDIGLNPRDVLFIDNNKKIIFLAKESGLNTINFVGAEDLSEKLKERRLI